MADKKRQLPDKIVDADGRPTLDFLTFMDDLIYGTAPDSIGTLLSGRNSDNARITGIIAGTVAIDPLITDRGKLSSELDVTATNVGSVATSAGASGALSLSLDRFYVYKQVTGGGSGTTVSVTGAASGGTSPYTWAWTKKSGDTLTVNSPTSENTTFSSTPGVDQQDNAVYTLTVTDDVSDTASADVTVSISDVTSGFNEGIN